MTDTLAHDQAQAREYITRIECALATLRVMVLQEQPEIATPLDLTTLDHVAYKLEHTEDAWAKARQRADVERVMDDARGEHDTLADAFGPTVQ